MLKSAEFLGNDWNGDGNIDFLDDLFDMHLIESGLIICSTLGSFSTSSFRLSGIKADSDSMGFLLLFFFFIGYCCSFLLHRESDSIPCIAWPVSCDGGENQRCDTFQSGANNHFPKRAFVVNVYGKRYQRVWGALSPSRLPKDAVSAKSWKCGTQANLAWSGWFPPVWGLASMIH